MEKKNSFWNAFMRRGASLFLVIAMLITSVTLPSIDWQKGEASTISGSLEPYPPVFEWMPNNRDYKVKSTNLSVEFVDHTDREQTYLSIKNTTGTGVNLKNDYAKFSGVGDGGVDVGKATSSARIGQKFNDKGVAIESCDVKVGDQFSYDIWSKAGGDAEAYLHCFENLWFHTNPKGMTFDTNNTSYAGITQNGEGLLYLDDLFAEKGELNWVPPKYGTDYTGYNSGTRYAYFLIKYSADNYAPRMRVWAYGDQTLSSGAVYQQHRSSDEGLNNYKKNIDENTAGYTDAVTAYNAGTATDEQKKLVENSIVYTEREFADGDGNIQYQLIWVDVVRGGDAGRELDNFALEINGMDARDFGLVGSDESANDLKDREFRLYGVYGFNSENDALAYMYKDIFEMEGKWSDGVRAQNFINAPQKIAVGDTVNSHVNDTLPGVYMERGIYDYSYNNKEGRLVPGVNSKEEVYGTSSGKLLWKNYVNQYMDGQVPHEGTGNAGYLETYKFTVSANAAVGNYKYRENLVHQSGLYSSDNDNYVNPPHGKVSKVEIHAPLSLVEYENDPSLSKYVGYEDAKDGHTYYKYDMDFAFMDAQYSDKGILLDDWSVENFISYLAAYDKDGGYVDENDEAKKNTIINSLPGFFHVARGSMTFDLGPVITDNYESVNIHYNKSLMSGFEGDITLTLYVTTFADQDTASAYYAGETKADGTSAAPIGVHAYEVIINKDDAERGFKTITIPKYKTEAQDGKTVSGVSSVVQNYALRVDTGNYNGEPLAEYFKIEDLVFAKRHTVDVTFKNELDRDEHNSWDYNNKAIGVNHKSVEKGTALDTVAVKGAYGTSTKDEDKNTDNDPQNFSYYLQNLACDDHCQYITYHNGDTDNITSATENVSVFAAQQSDYNFAYSIKLGKNYGIDTNKTESLLDGLGHVNWKFSIAENTLIDINVKWVDYANNIMAGMGVMDESGKVSLFPITSTTTSPDGTVSENTINISANASGTASENYVATGSNAPVIKSVSYTKDSSKASYYADGTMIVEFDNSSKKYATDLYMYYGDADGKILDGYMHMQRQNITLGASWLRFDLVKNTIIPANAKSIIVFAQNGYGRSQGYVVPLADGFTTAEAFGTPKMSFQVVSDTHVGIDLYNKRFEQMLRDVAVNDPDSFGIVINGDVIDGIYTGNNGSLAQATIEAQYQEVFNIYNEVKADYSNLPLMHWNIGNHEFYRGVANGSTINGGSDVVNEFLAKMLGSSSVAKKDDAVNGGFELVDGIMASRWITVNGKTIHMIFLGSSSAVDGLGLNLTKNHIDKLSGWLDSSKTVETFVFCHQSIYNTVAGSLPSQGWDGINTANGVDGYEAQLAALLAQYDNVIYFSGHSHWDLNSVGTMYESTDQMCDAFNTGSVAYLSQTFYNTYGHYGDYEDYESIGGSQGYYVEVYENGKVVVRGRDFEAGQWMPSAYFCVEPEPTPVKSEIRTDGLYLEINKTEFKYGETIELTTSYFSRENSQAIAIMDANGNIVQRGFIAIATGNGSGYTGEKITLSFNNNVVINDTVYVDDEAKTVYAPSNQGTLAPGVYYALCCGMDPNTQAYARDLTTRIQFTVTAEDDFDMRLDMPYRTVEGGNPTFHYGEMVQVNRENSWIGVYKADVEDKRDYLGYLSVGKDSKGKSGSCTYSQFDDRKVTTLDKGRYYAVVCGGASMYEELTERIYFEVIASTNDNDKSVAISGDKGSYKVGEEIKIYYSNINSGYDNVWIGIYAAADMENVDNVVSKQWAYANTSGSFVFNNLNTNGGVHYNEKSFLPAGVYYAVLLNGENKPYTWVSGSADIPHFQIIINQPEAPTVELAGDSSNFQPGSVIEVNYSGSMNPNWIGIFRSNEEEPNESNVLQRAYTGENGTIYFNDPNSGSTEKLPFTAIDKVWKANSSYANLPEGSYKIYAFDGAGNKIEGAEIAFTVATKNISVELGSETNQFNANYPIPVVYSDSFKGNWIGLFAKGDHDPLQVAYTGNSGTINFNPYFQDRTKDKIRKFDEDEYDVVSHVSTETLFLPVGEYFVQAFSSAGTALCDPITVSIVNDDDAAYIKPQYDNEKRVLDNVVVNGTEYRNFLYYNNEAVGVKYDGAAWGYWVSLYRVGEGPAYVGGKYNPLDPLNPPEADEDSALLQRAWINGGSGYAKADTLIEFNNTMNFSGSADSGTSDQFGFYVRHVNNVWLNKANGVLVLPNGEYYIVMCDDQGNELDRYYIKIADRTYEDSEGIDPDDDNPVTGMVGTWYSDAGNIVIDCEDGDKNTGVVEYSTKKTFTVNENPGYKFVGWYSLNADGTVKNWISDEKVLTYYNFYTSQIIVYALFVKLDDSTAVGDNVNAYEVDFYNDAHQIVQSVPVLAGKTVNISGLSYTPPIKVGYSFLGWNFPTAETKGVTPVYYSDEALTATADKDSANYYVINAGNYKIVYAKVFNETTSEYEWKAAYLKDVTSDVKVLAVWGPAGFGGVSSNAIIEYALYDGGKLDDGSFSGAINVNAFVETDAEVDGKKFIGWIDMKKGMSQSYVVGNTSGKVTENVVSGETAGNYDVIIYTNGTVNVGGTYYPIVSYKSRYVFKITNNMDLRAVYAKNFDLSDGAKPAVTMSQYAQYADRGNGKVTVTVNAIVTLDTEATGYKVVEYGYLYYLVTENGKNPTTNFYLLSSSNAQGVIDTVTTTKKNFLSMSTAVPEGEASKFGKLLVNTCNSAGQYYGYITTTAATNKALYIRPYAIYHQELANGETVGENEDWTIAYGETLRVELNSTDNQDALLGSSKMVSKFTEDILGTENTGSCYVNYPVLNTATKEESN